MSELASIEAPPPASGVGDSAAQPLAGIASLIASLPETPPASEPAAAPEPARVVPKPARSPRLPRPPRSSPKRGRPPPPLKSLSSPPNRCALGAGRRRADKAALPREFTG